jgi:hypothetical protein
MASQNSKVGKSHSRINRPSNIILPKSVSLSVQSLKTWKDAVELASLAENPNRGPLLEVYRSLRRDLHLKADIQTRVLKIMGSKYKITDVSGKEDPEKLALFKSKWFNRFLYHAMMATFEGSKVVELWDLDPENLALTAVNYIPSENVLFEKGIIVKEPGDEVGFSYKEGVYEPYYIQIGSNNDLGLLEDVAPDALAKKFAKAAWLEFSEKYGIAPRWVTTDSYSDTRHKELAEMMASMVNNHWAVLQGNEKIETMQVNGGNAKAIFDDLILRANSEMSKGVLGQDGTTNSNDKSGTYGSLMVMQDVADDRHNADKTNMSYLINDELLWRLELISPIYKGISNYKFEWDESKELSPEQLVDTVVKLSTAGYDVDIEYLTLQTGIPIIGIRQTNPSTPPEGEKKKLNSRQSLDARISNEIIAYYSEKQVEPTGLNIEAVDLGSYSKLIEKIAKDLHQGKMKPEDLNEDLVRNIYKDLNEAAGKGYGNDYHNYDSNAQRKLELRQNLYKFSGAKTYQEIAKMNFLLQGDDGEPRTFSEFQKEALKLNDEYNRNYLRTEFQTAQRAAAQAEKWAKYEDQKGLYPNLQYKTAKDDRVRDDHDDKLDIIKPVDDSFWDRWYPPNGWNCRCYAVQTTKPVTKGTPAGNPTMGFHNNVGKTGKAFDEEHPYFVFPKNKVGKIREGFESLKLKEPAYEEIYKKGKAKLETSIWADPKDIVNNIAAGKILVKKLKANVKIRPHVNSSILKKTKNPEFEINGRQADLKNIKSNKGVSNSFRKAKDQMKDQESYSVIMNLDGIKKPDLRVIKNELNNKISPERGKKISSVFFTYKNKAAELLRDEIIKRDYKKLEELFN